MKGLTDRQRQVLEQIVTTLEAQGFPPTLREIGQALGIQSTNGVSDHVKALIRKGYLQSRGHTSRTILPTREGLALLGRAPLRRERPAGKLSASVVRPPAAPALDDQDLPVRAAEPLPAEVVELRPLLDTQLGEVPILGRVAAGQPILATEQVEDRVLIDRTLLPDNHAIFGLRVQGDSMIGDGIFDGDFVFIRKQSSATPGTIVVALIEDEATVKRFYPEGDRVRFQPSNPAMQPIYVHRREFRQSMVIGVVVGVYRRL